MPEATSVTLSTGEPPKGDTATPPAGAQGDGNRVTIPDGGNTGEGTSERPSWLPEKFKSPEDLAKAYGELEKKLGAPKAPATSTQTPAAPKAGEGAAPTMDDISKEYAETGELSPASKKALNDIGIKDAQLDIYMRGLKALTEQTKSDLASAVGGVEQLDAVRTWAEANLSKPEIAAYDAAVSSGDTTLAKLLLQGINARYIEANGSEGQRVTGSATAATDEAPFASWAQVTEAMRQKQYNTDQAYRAKVERRLAASNLS